MSIPLGEYMAYEWEKQRRHDEVDVNGVAVAASVLTQILNMVTDPDPRRWYRFERQGDSIIVHVKREELV